MVILGMGVRSLANRKNTVAAHKPGRARELVLSKSVFDRTGLVEGDVVAVVAPCRLVLLEPRRLDRDDILTPVEARKVRRALGQIQRGETRSWRAIKNELGL